MSTARMAIATCRRWPDLTEDDGLLRDALVDAGASVDVVMWDDPAADWDRYDLVVIRSTWDYMARRAEFVDWARRCPRTANPAEVVAWNTDKRYLLDLERAGLPIVPTTFLEPGDPFALPPSWPVDDLVVKPTVSADAIDTVRFQSDLRGAADFARQMQTQGRAVMVQPYLSAIDAEGETAMIYLGGRFSHAIRKDAILAEDADVDAGHVVTRAIARTPTDRQRAVADAVLAEVPGGSEQLSYARVDLIPGADGAPHLLELEVTEPSLFLRLVDPKAVRGFAQDLRRRATA